MYQFYEPILQLNISILDLLDFAKKYSATD